MRMLLVALVACGGESGTTGSCETMIRDVTQVRGTCSLPALSGDFPGGGCSLVMEAYCGNEADCPAGWSLSCEASSTDPNVGVNCTYGTGGSCTPAAGDTVSYDYVQTLNGERGLIVMPDPTKPDRCTFRPCL